MSEIVERLRVASSDYGNQWLDEAADEITRLEARVKQLEGALEEIAGGWPENPREVARAALNPSQEPA